jgi:PAS domain S-box-containing protein
MIEIPGELPLEQVRDLQRCINDLVTLLAFPAMWTGRGPPEIISSFADGLLRILRLDMAYVRLTGETGIQLDCLRVPHDAPPQPALTSELFMALGDELENWPAQVPLGPGGSGLSIEPARLGLHTQWGVVVAGSQRPDFPVRTEQLLLNVAANQLVVALHEAQLLLEQKRVAEELDERVAERTAELAATNAELRKEIAERHHVQARLLASEREFTQIVNTIPALVWSTEPDGSAAFFSESYLAYFGLSLEQLLGWGWIAVVHPDDRDNLVTRWQTTREIGNPGETEARLRRLDGAYRWFLIRANPVLDDSGRVTKWYGINTDIDDRKQAEAALSKASTELANVARVTSLGVLTAAIAHEVNQPISGIITNASACLRMLSAQPPNIEGALETARRNIRDGKRAADVITRLRTLYTKRDMQPEPMDLNDAVREVASLSSSELQRNGVILRHELADDLPAVKGDRIQLQQVILNLLRNGSDAMSAIEDRPRELLIGTGPDEGDRVRLSVRDTGVGFSDDDARRIFEPFYTTKSDGMGIGLSVSRSIIEAHGGSLWATPNEGPGVTFAFSLPRADDSDPRPD